MAALYEKTPLRTRSAFRLLDLTPGNHDDPAIHIVIRSTNLTAASSTFEAISYTWGAENPRKTIYCGPGHSQQLDISLNCYTALRYLRHPYITRTLWVDAICVDQSNFKERSAQLRIMGGIFDAARRVVVFLGEENPECVVLFRHFAQTDEWIDSGEDPRSLPAPSISTVRYLANMLKRPWFSRIWAIQELSNASEICFMCGVDETTLEALQACLYGYRRNTRIIHQFPAPIEIVGQYLPNRLLECSTILQEMYVLIAATGQCEASDPRDRILALTPLIHPKSPMLENLVDYSKSTKAIFESFSLLLLADVGLVMLKLIRHPHSMEMSSWMPDFSQQTNMRFSIHEALGNFSSSQSLTFRQDFTVSEAPCIVGLSRQLNVKGLRYGRIAKLGPVIQLQTDQWSAREMLVKDLVATMDSMRLGMVHKEWPDSIMHAFQLIEEKDLHILLMRQAAPVNITVEKYDEEDVSTIISLCHGFRVFVTTDCELGMAPREAQAGDAVCLIKGSLVQCILREHDDDSGYWKMISGDCFLLDFYNGIMKVHKKQMSHDSHHGYLQDFISRQETLEEFSIC